MNVQSVVGSDAYSNGAGREAQRRAVLAGLLSAASAALDTDTAAARACLARAAELVIQRAADIESTSTPPVPRGGLAPWQGKRVTSYIKEHLGTQIRAAELAQQVRLSTSHFFRAFRETFGEAPMSYIARQRMSYAQQLMLRSHDPLSQVALACGLCDQAHFTRVFRRVVGMTPRAWRRQHSAPECRAR